MLIEKRCLNCGKDFKVPHWRESAKFCCRKCSDEFPRSENNVVCAICGKEFHRKPYHLKRVKGEFGLCCSVECSRRLRKIMMSGEHNHQFGLRGELNPTFKHKNIGRKNNSMIDILVYVGEWYVKPNVNGRIPEHRYLVEYNHFLFGEENFERIGDWFYLKDGLEVHHIDCNHSNNSVDNLCVLTKAEHRKLHNKLKPRMRNSKGQFIKNE